MTDGADAGRGTILTNDRVSGAVLLAFAGFVAFESGKYPVGTMAEPGPAYLPLLLAGVLAAFALLLIAFGAAAKACSRSQFGEAGKAVAVLAGMAFTALAMESIGFRLTIAVLLIYLLAVVERRNPFAAVGIAAVMSVGSFFVFSTLLRVPLPVGAIGL